jgi:hypothetical protein
LVKVSFRVRLKVGVRVGVRVRFRVGNKVRVKVMFRVRFSFHHLDPYSLLSRSCPSQLTLTLTLTLALTLTLTLSHLLHSLAPIPFSLTLSIYCRL